MFHQQFEIGPSPRRRRPAKAVRLERSFLYVKKTGPRGPPEAVKRSPGMALTSKGNDVTAVNPFSTGGGGLNFETRVQSALVSMLLVEGADPIFPDHYIRQLQLQTEEQGFATDDALVVSINSTGRRSKSLWSVKHEVHFTKGNVAFNDVLQDAWSDFKNSALFDVHLDAIVLATTRQSAKETHLLTLLDWSRATTQPADFFRRIATPGHASEHARGYLEVITGIVGVEPADDQLWEFLRRFYVLSFDFDQIASQDEARFKTVLGLAVEPSSHRTGDDLWNAITDHVAKLNPRGVTFTRDTLPLSVTDHCRTVTSQTGDAIRRLREHTDLQLSRIRGTIGPSISIDRADVVEQVASNLREHDFTIVTGGAGAGKSVAALSALTTVSQSTPLFGFQAMELARSHLDEVFAAMRIRETLSQLASLFALTERRFLLIESAEKLLEAEEREAFAMLLDTLIRDGGWKVVITCRDYATTMIREAFFTPLGVVPARVNVPVLSEAELSMILINAPPALRALPPRIHQLLRNPWYLNIAWSIQWQTEAAAPHTERGLRDVLWRRVVCRDDQRQAGLNRQRENCFVLVALNRAKALRPFVAIPQGYEAAAESLISDGLLVEDPTAGGVAPGHDVLEDWGLVRWIDGLFRDHRSPVEFFTRIGQELPIRRSFRQWLTERLGEEEQTDVRLFVTAAVRDEAIEPYWRDEIYVSILRSSEAVFFIRQQQQFLLADNKAALKRVLHLLRIACKVPNPHLRIKEAALAKLGDIYLVPDGPAWAELLRLIVEHISEFTFAEWPLIRGVLQDWKAAIHWMTPAPDGAREAGLIAVHYWGLALAQKVWERHRWEEIVEPLIAAPQAIADEFRALVDSIIADAEDRSGGSEELKRALLSSHNGWPACRFLPDVVVNLAEREWGLRETVAFDHRSSAVNLDAEFGLKTGYRFDYFPASALHGPFYPLLQWNSAQGMSLILDLVNIGTERYAAYQRVGSLRDDDLVEIDIPLAGGATRRQWVSARLWLMHRGSMPGPAVMECALMAVEKWLLDSIGRGLDVTELLELLIRGSNSVATTSVVASVVLAHPEKFGELALRLLSVPEFFHLDRARAVHDRTPLSAIDTGLSLPGNQLYEAERAESDKLPHRSNTFESLARQLQTGALRENVWAVIDKHLAELPPVEQQTDAHRLARLMLHRIDLRNYEPAETLDDGRIVYRPSAPAADVQAVVDKATPRIEATTRAANLFMWGVSVFEGRNNETYDPNSWQSVLADVKAFSFSDQELEFSYGAAVVYIAAVCVRDHWTELSPRDRAWCRRCLVRRVARHKDDDDEVLNLRHVAIRGGDVAATLLPLLLRDSSPRQKRRVRSAIADALTHSESQMCAAAARGLRLYGWFLDSAFVWRCVYGLIRFAELQRRSHAQEMRLPWDRRGHHRARIRPRVAALREQITNADARLQGWIRLSLDDSASCQIWPAILCILADQSASEQARRFFEHYVKAITSRRRRSRGHRRREHRNFEAEHVLRKLFAQFSLGCEPESAVALWQPIAAATGTHSDVVAEVLEQLVYAEDRLAKPVFWNLWSMIATALINMPDRDTRMAREHSDSAKIGQVLLFDRIEWKRDTKDWRPLHGHSEDICWLVSQLGHVPRVCRAFIKLLASIGNTSLLPHGVIWLSERIHVNGSELISDSNSLFLLAGIMTPLVYARTSTVRHSAQLRDALLCILDAMIDVGSSSAFRMREFLITPVAPASTLAV